MIISRTPFRISFFGGGTDYPAWFRENGGAVLATTFNKYCYISCRFLPPFFEYKHRLVYSKVEVVNNTAEIQHPAVRATLEFMGIKEGLEIHHDGDLPARTGLGSSSAFTVGMLNTLYALQGVMCTKRRLASEAIHIERNILKENVGSQDQILAALGGFNKIEFLDNDEFIETPITITKDRLHGLQSNLMLFFTGISRNATDIAKKKIENIPKKQKELKIMREMVDEALAIISGRDCLSKFGELLHESWLLKRGLTEEISNSRIDEIYEAARCSGAVGGKLLGAGGGGFLLIFARPEQQPVIRERLKELFCIPFEFETQGSQIVVYQPDMIPGNT
ncbi:MAG: kinase [Nitrospinae bacterium CG11_big_fil_rev_8_21_14_0_20_56_8]|nr:MAG: kinase [Nitrospinae bacterium CG11_big_fil_rev_8_21_14_0_20_56_8]